MIVTKDEQYLPQWRCTAHFCLAQSSFVVPALIERNEGENTMGLKSVSMYLNRRCSALGVKDEAADVGLPPQTIDGSASRISRRGTQNSKVRLLAHLLGKEVLEEVTKKL